MKEHKLCMDCKEFAVLMQNWLCSSMTEQTSKLCINLPVIKSSDKLPLILSLLAVMVAVCVNCTGETILTAQHS